VVRAPARNEKPNTGPAGKSTAGTDRASDQRPRSEMPTKKQTEEPIDRTSPAEEPCSRRQRHEESRDPKPTGGKPSLPNRPNNQEIRQGSERRGSTEELADASAHQSKQKNW
jgi:hypothetical protein